MLLTDKSGADLVVDDVHTPQAAAVPKSWARKETEKVRGSSQGPSSTPYSPWASLCLDFLKQVILKNLPSGDGNGFSDKNKTKGAILIRCEINYSSWGILHISLGVKS